MSSDTMFQIDQDFKDYPSKKRLQKKCESSYCNFKNIYNGDLHYYPGNWFYARIDSLQISKEKKNWLYHALYKKMVNTCTQMKNIFGSITAVKVRIDETGKKTIELPCADKKCLFRGTHQCLRNHLLSCEHKWKNEDAIFITSFYKKFTNYVCSVSRQGKPFPIICGECNIVVNRFDKHYQNFHLPIYKEKLNFIKIKHAQKTKTKKLFRNGCLLLCNQEQTDTVKNINDLDHSVQAFFGDVSTKRDRYFTITGDNTKSIYKKLLREKEVTDNKQIDLSDQRFKYIFDNSEEIIKLFRIYLQEVDQLSEKSANQHCSNVDEIWKSLDASLKTKPNVFCNPDLLEERYVLPLKKLLIRENKRIKKQPGTCFQASTIRVKLGSLKRFFELLKKRGIFIGLSWIEIETILTEIDEQNKGLRKLISERESELKDFNADNLLKLEDIQRYINSLHVTEALKMLSGIAKEGKKCGKIDVSMVTEIRNILMFKLTWMNALRSSNVTTFTLEDFKRAKVSSEDSSVRSITSKTYKTSFKYGRKIIYTTNELHQQLRCYVIHLRSALIKDDYLSDDKRYIFNTFPGRGKSKEMSLQKMSDCAVSACLTASFKKAEVLHPNNPCQRISPTRIRKAVATYLISRGKHSLETIAKGFMKHNEKTSAKYYVHQWNEKESTKMAIACNELFGYGTPVLSNGCMNVEEKIILTHGETTKDELSHVSTVKNIKLPPKVTGVNLNETRNSVQSNMPRSTKNKFQKSNQIEIKNEETFTYIQTEEIMKSSNNHLVDFTKFNGDTHCTYIDKSELNRELQECISRISLLKVGESIDSECTRQKRSLSETEKATCNKKVKKENVPFQTLQKKKLCPDKQGLRNENKDMQKLPQATDNATECDMARDAEMQKKQIREDKEDSESNISREGVKSATVSTPSWYSPRKHQRETVFEIAYVSESLMKQNKEPTKYQWYNTLKLYQNENIILTFIENEPWDKIRNILKAMWKKFKNKALHQEYCHFLENAKQFVYKNQNCLTHKSN